MAARDRGDRSRTASRWSSTRFFTKSISFITEEYLPKKLQGPRLPAVTRGAKTTPNFMTDLAEAAIRRPISNSAVKVFP